MRRADVIVVHTVSDRWLHLPAEVWREPGLRGRHADAATRFKARLEVKQAKHARVVLANSRMTADDLTARGVARERIVVIPFGVDAERFRPPSTEERGAARASFGIDPAAFVCGFVGPHGPRKGLPLALDVLAQAQSGEHLLVAGELRGGRWAREAAERGLSVTMPGKIADVRRAFWASDVFVYPSRYDAFGMAVLEAMACGVPVLVGNEAGSSEIVSDAGFVLSATDVGAWRTAIDRLRDDPARRSAMSARAREIARTRDWDEAGQILLDAYARVAE
jgi:UDP-glucose:(heptosyl)LPS alpha-1,3-glucosyltransferase